MNRVLSLAAAAVAFTSLSPLYAHAADSLIVPVNLVTAKGDKEALGTVTLRDGKSGLNITVDFANTLSPGPHGFHLHENGSCAPGEQQGAMVAALAAGGHYDPAKTGTHSGPGGEGHLGDLPILFVGIDEDGATATRHTLVAPRLTLADAAGRSIVIHENGDNFRDQPKALGGGGARVACGVVPAL